MFGLSFNGFDIFVDEVGFALILFGTYRITRISYRARELVGLAAVGLALRSVARFGESVPVDSTGPFVVSLPGGLFADSIATWLVWLVASIAVWAVFLWRLGLTMADLLDAQGRSNQATGTRRFGVIAGALSTTPLVLVPIALYGWWPAPWLLAGALAYVVVGIAIIVWVAMKIAALNSVLREASRMPARPAAPGRLSTHGA